MRSKILRLILLFSCMVGGGLIALLITAVIYLESRPDLEPWQTVKLDEEFRKGQGVDTFEQYLALEDRLFAQLDAFVYEKTTPSEASVNRYRRGSLADPSRWERNWNRSYELSAEKPVAGVLLVHGLTDSPYSLRALAETLNECGAHIVSLRVPGHGTVPSALLDVEWTDMAAAVEIGVKRVRQKVGEAPIFFVGYSNGGALAVNYALDSLRDERLPEVDRIVLLSPSIGVTPVAGLAVWQGRLGKVLGLRKLAWNSILPEYDPFKYNSFPVNAADQVHRLTKSLRKRMDALDVSRKASKFPPVLAFQSAVDATVSTSALIDVLFEHLPPGRENELLLYDLNRLETTDYFLTNDPEHALTNLLADKVRPYALTMITNRDPTSDDIIAKTWLEGAKEFRLDDVEGVWPVDVYSLSHIALPFRKEDSLYGDGDLSKSPGITLGNLAFRGERGVLIVPPTDQLRLHWNPFYSDMESRMLRFLHLKKKPPAVGREPRLF